MKIFKELLLISIAIFSSISVFSQNVGETAPDFTFQDTDGNNFTLSDHRGKVVFMFFFGNTCPSCLSVGGKTQSDINAVFESDENFVAVGLDMWDGTSNVASVSGFKSQTGIQYPLLIKAGSAGTAYGTVYDRLLVVDQDGILRHKRNTAAANDISTVIGVIEEYLLMSDIEDESFQEPSIGLFPNPVTDIARLGISLKEKQNVELLVYNSLGQLRYRTEFNLPAGISELDLDLSVLENGIHFYRLITSLREELTGKFVKR